MILSQRHDEAMQNLMLTLMCAVLVCSNNLTIHPCICCRDCLVAYLQAYGQYLCLSPVESMMILSFVAILLKMKVHADQATFLIPLVL